MGAGAGPRELFNQQADLDRLREEHAREARRLAALGRSHAMSLLAEIFAPARGVEALRFGYSDDPGTAPPAPAVKWRLFGISCGMAET